MGTKLQWRVTFRWMPITTEKTSTGDVRRLASQQRNGTYSIRRAPLQWAKDLRFLLDDTGLKQCAHF